MKLRIGGLQAVMAQTLEKEQAKLNTPTFFATSVAFSGERQEVPISWSVAPTGMINYASVSRVDISIPYTQAVYAQILKLIWANKTNNINIESPSGEMFELRGAYISEVHEVHLDSHTIDLCITYTHFIHGK